VKVGPTEQVQGGEVGALLLCHYSGKLRPYRDEDFGTRCFQVLNLVTGRIYIGENSTRCIGVILIISFYFIQQSPICVPVFFFCFFFFARN
jgi:hypothetical protein